MHDGADSPRDLFPALPNPQVAKPAIPPAQFTRQSNWERLVLDGIPDFLHVFSSDGIITYASNSCNAVTKYQPCELVGRPIADFIHPDDYGVFAHETDESISRLTSARFHYRFRSAGGSWIVLEARCRPFIIDPLDALPPPYAGMGCVDVVVMARPYPTGNISLLDSFLEFKMENVRLQTKIEQLKREACEDETTFHLQQQQPKENKIPAGPLLSPFSIPNRTKPKHESELPTDVPAPTFTAHIHVTLSQDTSALQSKPHIKMENSNGQGVPFTLVADPQASVVLGDLGIPISKSRITAANVSPSSKLKRKALESAESAEPNLCTFCGTVSSPEWRKGPEGPKTLCNACGIRWKRRSSIKDKV